ncbi:hypothetical protein AAES_60794 [Amazona aestiva]|uniref:Uncharacterized protein n=1 Tax=Amazona aestiva TaxID=12930 RepID=A0A0Q3PQN2_AMAAE|nr:hypothetical protein AAES_60794 [Amazona aestiva]
MLRVSQLAGRGGSIPSTSQLPEPRGEQREQPEGKRAVAALPFPIPCTQLLVPGKDTAAVVPAPCRTQLSVGP